MGKPIKNILGNKYGRLTVIEFDRLVKYKGVFWKCKCDCGTVKIIRSGDLISGNTTSCGCYLKEIIGKSTITHGQTCGKSHNEYPKAYKVWKSMINRCYTKSSNAYSNYGGRGITVCDRWKNSFTNFYEDMGDPPEGHSIERIDVNGNYCPENCKWIPNKDQHKNKRTTVKVLLNGELMIQADAAKKLNKHPATLCDWHKGRYKKPSHIDLVFLD
jgi:predicted nucleic acid-binding Zn ribbon protein